MNLKKDLIKRSIPLKLEIVGEHKTKDSKTSIRPTLTVSWNNDKTKIVTIGINPSNAGKQNNLSDMTVTKLARFLDMYGFGNFTMINLFECVSPNNIPDYNAKTDFSKHENLFQSADMILIVWGVTSKNAKVRAQKEAALKILAKYSKKLYCIKKTEKNTGTEISPLHPSRMNYETYEIGEFEVKMDGVA